MNFRVIYVQAKQNYRLLITFNNDETKNFDVKPYLNIGVFKELQAVRLFN
jgi:hypothetical protein